MFLPLIKDHFFGSLNYHLISLGSLIEPKASFKVVGKMAKAVCFHRLVEQCGGLKILLIKKLHMKIFGKLTKVLFSNSVRVHKYFWEKLRFVAFENLFILSLKLRKIFLYYVLKIIYKILYVFYINNNVQHHSRLTTKTPLTALYDQFL